ncbi:protein-methionine-sulfoxide reductase catalytic subunit MsrP [Thiosulfatimonas sediminis]|uniref:Protein-methionine-sulfoxide reductase catalytic subunit MsrP n=1 Tax=Thiosulfatimonas sediminis TaxID=2675054 RepID=A0A6F8PXX0_9GAMM|nr:protein-methionine-sulfoxide reductase catalytic subunit MsrP [Thiosulfatimonas sediminis]BBP46810.1 protein-methionine-sulfoxide reductase catalytic subunit MsrP [Thiosulfatimonas sediminis]
MKSNLKPLIRLGNTTPKECDVTPEAFFLNRRQFIRSALAAGLFSSPIAALADFNFSPNSTYRPNLKLTDSEHALNYNNFYELGTDKSDPPRYADRLITDNWQVRIEGECAKPQTFDMDDLLAFDQEERIYRFRCVEGWSMVVPWIGFPLSKLLDKVEPTSKAKYVEFISILDRENLPGQRFDILNWPYREGLRMDEAMHPLTLMTTGLYGKPLQNQNGAPIRLIVPWKYGFKSAKSIVTIRLTDKQPVSSWMAAAPSEYGFYSNVNPDVSHPRWSQAKERPLGSFFKQKTLLFNGYADEVASLYKGMDLKKNY